jgi:putative ABC transport system permease protein
MSALGQDLRYALRTLGRTPAFTAVAILTLALGIGATTVIFSVVHGVLMKPLPYRDPGRLVNIWVDLGVGNQSLPAVSPLDYLDYRERATLFEGFAAATGGGAVGATGALAGTKTLETQRVDVTPVAANFFQLFGVDPVLGRHFLPAEEKPGSPQVAILSHRLWKRRFAADPSIVGRQIILDGIDHTVVGVMPESFTLWLPAEAFLVTDAEIWKPLRYNYEAAPARNFTTFTVFGRLKPDVTLAQAQAEMDGLARQLRLEHPMHESSDMRIRVVPLQADIVKHVEPTLFALLGAVAFVLLIACANVAHLLLARATTRQHEMALRSALGAGSWRLMRQLATESMVLAAAGGAGGLVFAVVGLATLRVLDPADLPRMTDIRIDATVLVVTMAVSVLTALFFGLIPAFRAANRDLNRTLRASMSLSPGQVQLKLRNALVIAEVALALVLLVGAGLMMRSFVRLQQVHPGFEHERSLTFRVGMPFAVRPRPEARLAFLHELEARIKSIPGVTYVGFTPQLPLTGSGALQPYAYDEATARNWESATSDRRAVSPDYFAAMGTRVLEGRVFDSHDRSPRASIVIDETLAARVWPGQPAVGKRLQIFPNGSDGDLYADVIGVVEHMRILDLTRAVRPQIWTPMLAGVASSYYAVVRTDGDPVTLSSQVQLAVRTLDARLAIDRLRPMTDYVADGLAQARLSLIVMMTFAIVAVVLAVVGVYSVISYSVGLRTREIGIRIALGEKPSQVRNAVMAQGLRLIVPSLAVGALAAWILSQFMTPLLYQTHAGDSFTFAATIALLLAVGLAGCYIPARRATAVSPLRALRTE